MKISAAAISAALLAIPYPGRCASIRRRNRMVHGGLVVTTLKGKDKDGSSSRVLDMADFAPLDCNVGLEQQQCQPWSSRFGTASVHSERVIVDCGECIEMDLDGPDLVLLDGIDIRGKLVFTNIEHGLTVNTTMVAVQGELVMYSTKPVDGIPSIRFLMTGEKDQFFEPIDNNAMNCNHGELCKAGKKAIAVAGGRIEVKGLPDLDTPTWVKLYDVERILGSGKRSLVGISSYAAPPVANGCAADGVYFGRKFSGGCGDKDEFSGTPGSKIICTDSSMSSFDRTSTFHGVQLDLKNFRRCLEEAPRTYLLSARVRLTGNLTAGVSPTECAPSGEHCLKIQQQWMDGGFSRFKSTLWEETPALGAKQGELLTIAASISFEPEHLDPNNVFQLIEMIGPAPHVSIKIEEFNLYLPPRSLFPHPGEECSSLAPVNGNAETGNLNPYPFYVTHPWIFATIEEDPRVAGNHFFKVRGRIDRNPERAGLAWDLELTCLHEGDSLNFQVNVRLPIGASDGSLVLKPYLRAEFDSGSSSSELLAACPVVEDSEWTQCQGVLTLPTGFIATSVQKLYVVLGATPGVDYDVDDISLTLEGGDPNTLVVDKSIMGRWAKGAELLITSHTTKWDGHQVRKISNVLASSNPSYARVQLDSPITRPTTLLDSADFAVEVALLSRNIVFEGGPDLNPLHGGHFWVLHTPLVDQFISGLEIRNFGQQGSLGRYPLHFHFCGDVEGAVVSKNTVRDSHQRAIVVHGTDKLRVEENVVFNTKGHAIILEDGIETGNLFYRNLGAATDKVDVVIPDNGFNGRESDALPSTYWISNPTNSFVENVAAGSQSSGFWYELKKRGTRADQFDFDPRTSRFGVFLNNVAHSNDDRGFRTYPVGYIPDKTANLVGLLSYRNDQKGLFFHQTENIAIINSTFADNGVAVDIDRADFISLINTTIIGQTDLYRKIMNSQNAPSVCSNQEELVGIELHTFVRNVKNHGGVFQDLFFAGFEPGTCSQGVAHVKLDQENRETFDWLATFESIQVADDAVVFDFCPVAAAGVTDVYLVDVDGSFNKNGRGIPGSFISNSENMLAFTGQCDVQNNSCSAYCEACFRTVRFHTNPKGTENYLLQICATSGSPCIHIESYMDPDSEKANSVENLRLYNAHLPHGRYEAAFVTTSRGQEVWPTFVSQTHEEILCTGSLEDGAVQVKTPSVTLAQCNSLVRNGAAESLDWWLYKFGGLILLVGSGMDGSNALADTQQGSFRDSISQFLDTRCFNLTRGRSYEITAWVKLVDETGNPRVCHHEGFDCPEVRFVLTPGTDQSAAATLVPQLAEGAFQLLHGIVVVDQEMADSTIVELQICRNQAEFSMLVDNVSMVLMPQLIPADPLCGANLVWNGDFSSGDGRFWSHGSGDMKIVDRGVDGYYLSVSNGNPDAFLKAGCFEAGEQYQVSIVFKILHKGQLVVCDPSGLISCPSAKIVTSKDKLALEPQRDIVEAMEAGVSGSGWSFLYGIFAATDATSEADALSLKVEGLMNGDGYEYIFDSVIITGKPQNCEQNVLVNSDMAMGVLSFWGAVGSGFVESVTPGYDGESDRAMYSHGRTRIGHGPGYNTDTFLDRRCLVPGTTWEIQAQVKLLDSATREPTYCNIDDPTSSPKACPAIRVEIKDANGNQVLDTQVREYTASFWDIHGWNEFEGRVTLPMGSVWDGVASKVLLQFRNFPMEMDVIVDNFVVRQVRS